MIGGRGPGRGSGISGGRMGGRGSGRGGSGRGGGRSVDRYAFAGGSGSSGGRGRGGRVDTRTMELTVADYDLLNYLHKFNLDEGDGQFTAFGNVAHKEAFRSEYGMDGYDRFVAVNEEAYKGDERFDNIKPMPVPVPMPMESRFYVSHMEGWDFERNSNCKSKSESVYYIIDNL